MIYITNRDKSPDMIFFILKDGYQTKIEKLSFDKDQKEPLSSVYEMKTSHIFIFTFHDNHFFIMDDSWSLKKLQYDKRS